MNTIVRRLLGASVAESAADDIARSMLPMAAVLTLGAGGFTVGVLGAVGLASFPVTGPWAGALVDRWPKRTVLWASNLARGGSTFARLATVQNATRVGSPWLASGLRD